MDVTIAFMVLVGLLGGSIGSFLNVVIYRLPHPHLSIVKPASRCPGCGTRIKAWHNIPIVGWLVIRGRCAACRVPISPRYPLVELAMCALTVALFVKIVGGPPTPEALTSQELFGDILAPFALYTVFVGGLIAAAFIDLDWFILPNELTLPGLIAGLATSALVGHHIGVTWQDGLIGALVGALFVLVIIYGWALLTGREGMGGGDFKLLAVIGAYLGWQVLPLVLLLSSVQALLFAALFRKSFLVEELPPDPMELTPTADSKEAAEAPTPDAAGDAPPEMPDDATGTATPDSDGSEGGSVMLLALPYGPFLALAAIELLFFREELMDLVGMALDG